MQRPEKVHVCSKHFLNCISNISDQFQALLELSGKDFGDPLIVLHVVAALWNGGKSCKYVLLLH